MEMTTVQDFIDQLQSAVNSHASMADRPATLDSPIRFVDANGDESYFRIDASGGNFFDPEIIVTVG